MDVGGRQVELTIRTVVIEGFGRVDEHALAAGVRGELVRLLSAEGLPDGLTGRTGTRRAAALQPREGGSAALGAAVGQAVYGALSR